MFDTQKTQLARFIEEHANRSPYNYNEIAILCGFNTADTIHAFIRGEIRLPLDHVAPLAGALGCDGAQLFMLTLQTWFSKDLFDQVQACFASIPDDEDAYEREWLIALREVFDGEVPALTVFMRKRLELVLKAVA